MMGKSTGFQADIIILRLHYKVTYQDLFELCQLIDLTDPLLNSNLTLMGIVGMHILVLGAKMAPLKAINRS